MAKQLDDGKGLEQAVAGVKDANSRGALHFAAGEGKTDMCKYLVEELKVDVDTKDDDGTYFPLSLIQLFEMFFHSLVARFMFWESASRCHLCLHILVIF